MNQIASPATQTPRIQVSQQEANLITFTPIAGRSGEPRTTQKTEEPQEEKEV